MRTSLIKCSRSRKVDSAETDAVNLEPDDDFEDHEDNELETGEYDEKFTKNFSGVTRKVHGLAQRL